MVWLVRNIILPARLLVVAIVFYQLYNSPWLTDAVDTGSGLPPRKAARIAAARGVRIHTVAVGDPSSKAGDIPAATSSLREIAETTGGRTFAAASRDEIVEAARKLDEIEALDLQGASYRPRRPLYHWPLGAGTLLGVVFYLATGARVLFREAAA